jgi:hypothetical protein
MTCKACCRHRDGKCWYTFFIPSTYHHAIIFCLLRWRSHFRDTNLNLQKSSIQLSASLWCPSTDNNNTGIDNWPHQCKKCVNLGSDYVKCVCSIYWTHTGNVEMFLVSIRVKYEMMENKFSRNWFLLKICAVLPHYYYYLTTCILHVVLWGQLNQGVRDGHKKCYIRERWEMHTVFVRKSAAKGPLEKPWCNMDLKDICCEDVNWIQLAQGRVWWWVYVSMVMNLQVL